MALQVWLPLNGDLHNQGLTNINIINNGATIDNNGKIGKCYSFNGSNNYLYSNYKFYNNKYSVCAWVYTTSSSVTQTICCDRTAVGSGFSTFLIGGKLRIDCGGNNLQWTTGYTYPTNTWFHLAITYNGTNVSYYINGEYKETKAQTISSSYWGNITSIGASQANGSGYGNYLNGKLNDIRIYNHCLSSKEVEEIAKGLVLHYKLNNETDSSNWLLPNSIKTITRSSGNTFVDYEYLPELISCSDTTYKVEFDAKGSVASMGLDLYFRNSSGSAYAVTEKQTLTTNWKHYSLTISGSPSTLEIFRARCYKGTAGDIISIRNLKLLSNNTPYLPSQIYDSSGYNNNGIITGTVTLDDSPKYTNSTYMNNTSSANKIQSINTILNSDNKVSVSFWTKFDKSKGMILFATPAIEFAKNTSTYAWLRRDSSVKGFSLTNLVTNEWNHIVTTRNGDTFQLWINGVQETQNGSNNNWVHNSEYLYLLNREYNNNYGADASISDFRIYNTVLTENQIKELYNNSKIINGVNKTPRVLE